MGRVRKEQIFSFDEWTFFQSLAIFNARNEYYLSIITNMNMWYKIMSNPFCRGNLFPFVNAEKKFPIFRSALRESYLSSLRLIVVFFQPFALYGIDIFFYSGQEEKCTFLSLSRSSLLSKNIKYGQPEDIYIHTLEAKKIGKKLQ